MDWPINRWPYITVGKTYEYSDHPTQSTHIRVIGDLGISAFYPRKLFLDVAECRNDALTEILK
jgi:hypothetical protein